jgi:hypothetical protein
MVSVPLRVNVGGLSLSYATIRCSLAKLFVVRVTNLVFLTVVIKPVVTVPGCTVTLVMLRYRRASSFAKRIFASLLYP